MCYMLHKVAGKCHIFFEIERLSLSCLSCADHPLLKIKHFVVHIFKAERHQLEQLSLRASTSGASSSLNVVYTQNGIENRVRTFPHTHQYL